MTKQTKILLVIFLIFFGAIIFLFTIGIGVPAWLRMQISANETAATRNLDALRKLQNQYASKNQGNFAPTFDELIRSVQLDEKFNGENPIVNGYIYTMKVRESSGTQPAFYSTNADPQISEGLEATGNRSFYLDSTLQTIKMTEENRPARADDSPIQD